MAERTDADVRADGGGVVATVTIFHRVDDSYSPIIIRTRKSKAAMNLMLEEAWYKTYPFSNF